jgi:hypothetical protein
MAVPSFIEIVSSVICLAQGAPQDDMSGQGLRTRRSSSCGLSKSLVLPSQATLIMPPMGSTEWTAAVSADALFWSLPAIHQRRAK